MIGLPAGRSGRLWLRERLEVGRRAAGILDQKARVLGDESRRLEQLREETAADWAASLAEAETWNLRAAMLGGGSAALANAEAMIGAAADVRIPWRSSMGLAYPGETETRLPDPVPLSALGRTSCLPFAAVAYRRAVEAAARHASVEHALRVVRRELAATQRRRRAISHRLIPRLEAAWADLEQRLDELDRDDMVRARWVSERTGTGRAVIRAGEGEAR